MVDAITQRTQQAIKVLRDMADDLEKEKWVVLQLDHCMNVELDLVEGTDFVKGVDADYSVGLSLAPGRNHAQR